VDMAGVWLGEIAELSGMRKTDIERIKSILSTTTRRFRAPYGHAVETHARRGVFAGTTNADNYLADDTGGRRFWPVRCGKIDLQWLTDTRDQLFAEAVADFKAGRKWWYMPRKITERMQADRLPEDPWVDTVRQYIATRTEVTPGDLLSVALGIPVGNQTRAFQTRLGIVMKSFSGWGKRQNHRGERLWRRIDGSKPTEPVLPANTPAVQRMAEGWRSPFMGRVFDGHRSAVRSRT
jgi:predicted P-loop ATPase